ncbi:endospore germination permease [Brevibacillus agri]|uniref:endospore germination permease n=1 Tax=Brevibacillus agri TaxID=51101 RepID=UPI0018CE53C1|nr:spore gernimation protein [Brevibacillus agri]
MGRLLEQGKISSAQMGKMVFLAIVASAVTVVPSYTGKYAENDLWLSPFLASLIGFFTVYIAFALNRLYPQQTVIQYSTDIIGKVPGKIFGLLLLFFYVHMTGLIARGYAEFIIGNFLPQTPISVVILTMIAVCAYAVRAGLEVIGRTAQGFFLLFLFPLLLMPFLLQDMHFEFLFPMFERGLLPSVKGALIPQGYFSEVFLMSFLLLYVTNRDKSMRAGMLVILGIALLLTCINFFILLVFGRQAADYMYPVMVAFRYISIADFFENLDSVVMTVWILGMYVKISVFYYATVLGTSQWLELSDYRPIVIPIGMLIAALSFWSMPNLNEAGRFDIVAFPFYGPLMQTICPLLLLGFAYWRKKGKQQSQAQIAAVSGSAHSEKQEG